MRKQTIDKFDTFKLAIDIKYKGFNTCISSFEILNLPTHVATKYKGFTGLNPWHLKPCVIVSSPTESSINSMADNITTYMEVSLP